MGEDPFSAPQPPDDHEQPTRRADPVEPPGDRDPAPPVRREPVESRTYGRSLPHVPAPSDSPPPIRDAAPPRKRRTARQRRDSGLYLPWWTLLILVAGVAGAAALILLAINALGGGFTPGGETPIFIVITSTPTPDQGAPTLPPTLADAAPAGGADGGTPFDAPTEPFFPTLDIATEPPFPTATPDANAPITGGSLAVGAAVLVSGVDAAGLNIREGPGTGFPVLLIAPEGMAFTVTGGPEFDGTFTWWQVQNVDDPALQGWAVEEFLLPQ